MNAQQIRKAYLEFGKSNGHVVIPRANIVPQDDPTTLFTGSGMQPLLQYLLGQEHPQGTRLTDSQTCLRAEDIEEVGDNRHTTFFEMLGNWSLGDYFKKEQLRWFWTFLVDEVGINPNKLYATCYLGDPANKLDKDEESAQIWVDLYKEKGITAEIAEIGSEDDGYKRGYSGDERIFYYDGSKNWWSRAGAPSNMPAGEPGGPDSEVFFLFEDIEHDKSFGENCHPNCDCGRFLEIGNSVFMQYIKNKDGSFSPLPKQNVDFGAGLERIAAAANDSSDMFKISLLWPIVEKAEELSGVKYADNVQAMRVIADHMRAAVWLAVDGVLPTNKEQGYVARRMVRRAVLKAHELGVENGFCEAIVPTVIEIYKEDFPEMTERADEVLQAMIKEEKAFRQTLKKGIKIFATEVEGQLNGETVFKLYDTYGFPAELSLEQAKSNGIKMSDNWQAEFDEQMKQQRDRSRTATKGQFKGGIGGSSDEHAKLHTATHLMYESLRRVLGDHVQQRGSNVTDERLRFDFDHPQKVTPEEVAKIEEMVNAQIDKALPVSFNEFPTDEAIKKGALGQFGDRYGDTVKVYQVGEGETRFSFEICGGPHANNTGDLKQDGKRFKIVKEQSSSAGVRRIKAVLQ